MRIRLVRQLRALTLFTAMAIGCRAERESIELDTGQSESGTPPIADSALLAKVDSLIGLVIDSAAIGEATLLYPPIGSGAPPLGEHPANDDVRATATELAELRTQLTIPVSGILPADIVDSFADARGGRLHEAIDILAPRGTAVLSATNGRLLKLHQSTAGGLMVYAADANDRFVLMYGHLDGYADGLTEGMPLSRGQFLGYVGTTGNAPPGTPHLHFSIARGTPSAKWWKGNPVNPYELLKPQ